MESAPGDSVQIAKVDIIPTAAQSLQMAPKSYTIPPFNTLKQRNVYLMSLIMKKQCNYSTRMHLTKVKKERDRQ